MGENNQYPACDLDYAVSKVVWQFAELENNVYDSWQEFTALVENAKNLHREQKQRNIEIRKISELNKRLEKELTIQIKLREEHNERASFYLDRLFSEYKKLGNPSTHE